MKGRAKVKTGQSGFDQNKIIREKELKFRVSHTEYLQICQAAHGSKYNSLAQYLRESLLAPSNELRRSEIKSNNKNLLAELSKIGNNLNQIARKCNRNSKIEEEMLAEISSFKKSILKIIKKMG